MLTFSETKTAYLEFPKTIWENYGNKQYIHKQIL